MLLYPTKHANLVHTCQLIFAAWFVILNSRRSHRYELSPSNQLPTQPLPQARPSRYCTATRRPAMNTEDYWSRKANREWWERKDNKEVQSHTRPPQAQERSKSPAGYGYTRPSSRLSPASVAVRAALLMVGFILVLEVLSASMQGMDSLSLGAVAILAAILALTLAKSYIQAWIRHVPPKTTQRRRRPTIPLLAGAIAGGLVSLALNASGLTQPLVDLCRGLLAI